MFHFKNNIDNIDAPNLINTKLNNVASELNHELHICEILAKVKKHYLMKPTDAAKTLDYQYFFLRITHSLCLKKDICFRINKHGLAISH